MKRITTTLAVSAAAMLGLTALAFAVPVPNSAVTNTRIFDDCPISNITITNNYPSSITIADENLPPQPQCSGFANYHNWRFSSDGTTAAQFGNADTYEYSCDFVLNGTGEGGIGMGPWWAPNDPGQFNVKTGDNGGGEIACFGGTMPFYSFTFPQNGGLNYVTGTPINLSITYAARDNSAQNPGQIFYRVTYNNQTYSSGPLNFGPRNPNDPPHGDWGSQEPTVNGGQVKMIMLNFPNHNVSATWSNIQFSAAPTPAQSTSWGKIKSLYR